MALQGNPFLGKLKIPAPDLTRIPITPFNSNDNQHKNIETIDVVENSKKDLEQKNTLSGSRIKVHLEQNRGKTEKSEISPRKVLEKSEISPRKVLEKSEISPRNTIKQNNTSAISPRKVLEKSEISPRKVLEKLSQYSLLDDKNFCSPYSIESIRMKQRFLCIFLFEKAFEQGGRDNRLASHITSAELSQLLDSSEESSKDIARQLMKKSAIKVHSFVDGRGGWTNYILAKNIHIELLMWRENGRIEYEKQPRKVLEKSEISPRKVLENDPSSSSINIYKTTTTRAEDLQLEKNEISQQHELVDITPLEKIGLTNLHLAQVFQQKKLSILEIQNSIDYFAFDLEKNEKEKKLRTYPLNYFMGILNKGVPYAPPENFESPADQARKKILAFKEKKELERKQEEEKIFEIEFLEWKEKLNQRDLLKILPDFARKPGEVQNASLRSFFNENIFKNEIVRQIEQSLSEARNEKS